jgi:heme exporter protein CcmD
MMPDLGDYAGIVISAYLGTLLLLVGMVVVSYLRAMRTRKLLEELERDRHR